MKLTLESLYRSMPDDGSPAYDSMRAAKVAEIAEYLDGLLRDNSQEQREFLAEEAMKSAEEMGRFRDDCVSGEISRRYTADRNPLVFTI